MTKILFGVTQQATKDGSSVIFLCVLQVSCFDITSNNRKTGVNVVALLNRF